MRRGAVACIVIGLLAGAAWILLERGHAGAMPSYLAAWLFWIAVPLGALPLVMLLECLDGGNRTLLPILRRSLLLLPLAAVFSIPVLQHTAILFRRAGLPEALPAAWMAPRYFIARTIAILAALTLFALVFAWTPRRLPRRFLAGIGLFLHVSLVTVAAVDWILALQPGLGSSAIGVLLVASQIGVAGCLAAFVLALGTRGRLVQPSPGILLGALLCVWAFLHFVQFLVVWSADLPAEIVWYQARTSGLGGAVVWFACIAAGVGLAILPTGLGRLPAVLASVAGTLLLMHLAETLWLVTPAFRGHFTLELADLLAVLGIGGLLVGVLLATLPRMSEAGYRANA